MRIIDHRRTDGHEVAPESRMPNGVALLTLLAVSLALLARINSSAFVENSLWYEDGIIFVNQSYEHGLKSLWMPYAGYYVLYNRVVALLATQMPLEATPYVFFLAWLMSFLAIVYVVIIRGKSAGLTESATMYLLCAIALLPTHGSTFFNLNHAHFFLGIALAIFVCIPYGTRTSITERSILLIASLTGPFSAFLMPVMLMQLVMLRDFSARMPVYTIVLGCGLIQSARMLGSQRIGYDTIDADVEHWLKAISSFITFGASNKLAWISAAAFWAIASLYFWKWAKGMVLTNEIARSLAPLYAVVMAIIAFAAGACALGSSLPAMSPLEVGARYFLVPYSLLFFVTLTITATDRAAHTAVSVLLGVVCAAGFSMVDSDSRGGATGLGAYENLQWKAFAKLQRLKPDILIPINTSLPMYPPPHVIVKGAGVRERTSEGFLLEPVQHIGAEGRAESGDGESQDKMGRTFYFTVPRQCGANRYLAVEIDIWRARMGWATVYWGKPGSFSAEGSLRRFYPAGAIVMQFAFRRNTSDYLLKFDPTEGVPDSAVVRSLSRGGWKNIGSIWKGHGRVIAEPTAPGGMMRIDQVRLFCLH